MSDWPERILDAAGRCFAARGVRSTSIGDVAREAGCSRPTVYRWFDDRAALHTAFVHREARRLGRSVVAAVEGVTEPGPRAVAAVLAAVAGVRAEPTLAAWFEAEGVGAANEAATDSPVLHALAAAFLGAPSDPDLARWVVRVTMSLLAAPGRDTDDERALLERFLAPAVERAARTGG